MFLPSIRKLKLYTHIFRWLYLYNPLSDFKHSFTILFFLIFSTYTQSIAALFHILVAAQEIEHFSSCSLPFQTEPFLVTASESLFLYLLHMFNIHAYVSLSTSVAEITFCLTYFSYCAGCTEDIFYLALRA